jgi:hypothetical protein
MEQVTELFAQKMEAKDSSPEDEEHSESPGPEKTETEEEAPAKETEAENEPSAEEETESEEEKDEKAHEESVPYERFKEVNEKLQQYEPLAARHYQVEQYLHKAGITPREYQEGLELMALRKSNPTEYTKKLQAQLEDYEVSAGTKLPADLQKKVDDGLVDIEIARELAQLRSKNRGLESKTAVSEEDRQRQHIEQMASTLQSWATQKMQLDPAFKPKANAEAPDGMFEMMCERFQYLAATRPPATFADVQTLAETAYNDTKKRIRGFVPPPPKKKVLKGTGSTSKPKEPKTVEDVTEQIASKYGIG